MIAPPPPTATPTCVPRGGATSAPHMGSGSSMASPAAALRMPTQRCLKHHAAAHDASTWAGVAHDAGMWKHSLLSPGLHMYSADAHDPMAT